MKIREKYTDHTVSLIVYNKPGVLSKIVGLINRRGFNVENLTVGRINEKGMARMTIVVRGDDRSLEQIQKQLFKIVDVVRVAEIKLEHRVAREMALIKIKLTRDDQAELLFSTNNILQLITIYKGEIVDTSPGGIIVEITGSVEKIDGFINLLPEQLIAGIARTGIVAMQKLMAPADGKRECIV
ncbi:MAG: acetolactate synthase small subunit [bacterium]|nr:acetolactate synthase small subunit [bacterium]